MTITLVIVGIFIFFSLLVIEFIRFHNREIKLAFLIEEKGMYEEQRKMREMEEI